MQVQDLHAKVEEVPLHAHAVQDLHAEVETSVTGGGGTGRLDLSAHQRAELVALLAAGNMTALQRYLGALEELWLAAKAEACEVDMKGILEQVQTVDHVLPAYDPEVGEVDIAPASISAALLEAPLLMEPVVSLGPVEAGPLQVHAVQDLHAEVETPMTGGGGIGWDLSARQRAEVVALLTAGNTTALQRYLVALEESWLAAEAEASEVGTAGVAVAAAAAPDGALGKREHDTAQAGRRALRAQQRAQQRQEVELAWPALEQQLQRPPQAQKLSAVAVPSRRKF